MGGLGGSRLLQGPVDTIFEAQPNARNGLQGPLEPLKSLLGYPCDNWHSGRVERSVSGFLSLDATKIVNGWHNFLHRAAAAFLERPPRQQRRTYAASKQAANSGCVVSCLKDTRSCDNQ